MATAKGHYKIPRDRAQHEGNMSEIQINRIIL